MLTKCLLFLLVLLVAHTNSRAEAFGHTSEYIRRDCVGYFCQEEVVHNEFDHHPNVVHHEFEHHPNVVHHVEINSGRRRRNIFNDRRRRRRSYGRRRRRWW